MRIKSRKELILREIKNHYQLKSDVDFANFLDIPPTSLATWYKRGTFDYDILFAKCLNIDANYLLTGKGEIELKKLKGNHLNEEAVKYNSVADSNVRSFKPLPLIPIEAMAGYGSGELQVMEYEKEKFIIPTFEGADFLISVRGSSMFPKYNSGDIVGCRKLTIDAFFQWNKVYVLDTTQGALIKRVRKGKDKDHVLIVSENQDYEPFELHRSEIYSIAIVIGVIRLE